MRLFIAAFAMMLASLVVAEEKPVEIPLKEIWAANMPSTRNIRELEHRTEGDHRQFGPLMHTVYRTMHGGRGERAGGSPDAGPGFPIPGSGIAALHAVYDILVDKAERPETVPVGEVSIVFFARLSPADCYLEKVERNGTDITLTYRLHARQTGNLSFHLALIPLGALEPGKYDVRHVQLPVALAANDPAKLAPPMAGERLKRSVSDPYSFKVE